MKVHHLLLCAGLLLPAVTPVADAQTIRIIGGSRDKKDVELDWLLDSDSLFTMSPDELETKAGKRHFVWQDKERTRARFNPDKYDYKLKGHDIGEVLINFKDGKLNNATISVMNKGDEDDLISQTEFTTAVGNVNKMLDGASGVKAEKRKKEEMLSPQGDGAVWRSKKGLYLGEWLFLKEKKEEIDGWIWTTRAHGEFVRVRILPPQVQLGIQTNKQRITVTRPVLASRVKRDGAKVTIESVPMVDQGSKGYCAVASFERVLRHYGADIDMHDLANAAETYGGTNPQKMKTAIMRVAQKLSMKPREIYFMKKKSLELVFKDYNRYAKKDGKTEVTPGESDWGDVDPPTFLKSRTASPDYVKFKTEVVNSINKGIPVMWALQLGLFWEDGIEDSFEANRYAVTKDGSEDEEDEKEAKEDAEERKEEIEEMRKKNPRPPAYMGGGHMRLIVGYDTKYGLIYYTDSWGPGHELKSMPIDQAWTTTLALFVVEPN